MDSFDAIREQLEARLDSLRDRIEQAVQALDNARSSLQETLAQPVDEVFGLEELKASLAQLEEAAASAAGAGQIGVTLDQIRRLDAPRSQSELLHELMAILTEHAARAAVLVFRNGTVTAWSGIGFDEGDALRQWHGEVATSPLLSSMAHDPQPYRCVPGEEPLISQWLSGLEDPHEALLVPVSLRGKVMGAVYADHLTGRPWNPGTIQALVAVACWLIDSLHHRTKVPTPMIADLVEAADVEAAVVEAPEPAIVAPVEPPPSEEVSVPIEGPVVEPEPALDMGLDEEPAVAHEPEFEVSEPVAAHEPEFEVSEPVVAHEPEFDVSEPAVAHEPEFDVSEPAVISEPEFDVSEPAVISEPEFEVSEPEVVSEPEFEVPEPVAAHEPEFDVSEPEIDVSESAGLEAPDFAVSEPEVMEEPAAQEGDADSTFDPSATVQVDLGEVAAEMEASEPQPVEEPQFDVGTEAAAQAPEVVEAPPIEAPPVEPPPGEPLDVEAPAPPPVEAVIPPVDLTAEPPADAPEAAPQLSAEDETRHEEARRFARLLVSEIKLYNEEEVDRGRVNRDLYQRLKEDIDRSREMYEKRISPDIRATRDYFHEELVRILADGDPDALGM